MVSAGLSLSILSYAVRESMIETKTGTLSCLFIYYSVHSVYFHYICSNIFYIISMLIQYMYIEVQAFIVFNMDSAMKCRLIFLSA